MIIIKRDNPQIFGGKAYLMTNEERNAMNMVADAITINRGALTQLLLKHDIRVAQNASKEELLDAFTVAFTTKPKFQNDFSLLNNTQHHFFHRAYLLPDRHEFECFEKAPVECYSFRV